MGSINYTFPNNNHFVRETHLTQIYVFIFNIYIEQKEKFPTIRRGVNMNQQKIYNVAETHITDCDVQTHPPMEWCEDPLDCISENRYKNGRMVPNGIR